MCPAMKTPAEVVIEICGGPRAVANICGVDVSRVHRWTYPPDRGGTGGIIPAKHQNTLLDAARSRGLALRPEHFFLSPADDAAIAPQAAAP
jgi:hypothetical protein